MLACRFLAHYSRRPMGGRMASQGGFRLFAGQFEGAIVAFTAGIAGGLVAVWESFVVPDGQNRRVCQSRAGRCSP